MEYHRKEFTRLEPNKNKGIKVNDKLVFTEEGHKYTLNGIQIYSTTQYIDGAGLSDFQWVNADVLERSADLGKKVHSTTELYDKGVLNIDELHPTLKAYLDSWIKFKKDFDFVCEEIELEVFHPVFRYANRIDRTGFVKGIKSIVDLKSGIETISHPIQTAGYLEAYNHGKDKLSQAKKRYAVYLSPDGYKVREHKNPTDKNVFFSCITIYNYKRSSK